jgi:intracellular sulfur oxidation DsrE/DsrF family protein
MIRFLLIALAMPALASPASAQTVAEGFATGPVIEEFGPVSPVETSWDIPEGAVLRLSYDVSRQAQSGTLNRTLETAARFLNMHGASGVPVENMQLAIVFHGAAVRDVTGNDFYLAAESAENANLALIDALTAHNVRIIVCGQSAAYYGVELGDLAPGVEMALSAMTAHVLLQQDGYAINPF